MEDETESGGNSVGGRHFHNPESNAGQKIHGRWFGATFGACCGDYRRNKNKWLPRDPGTGKPNGKAFRPTLEFHHRLEENAHYKVAVSEMQGWRNNMEDSDHCKLGIRDKVDEAQFGVFDGHGGDFVAKVCGTKVHTDIEEQREYNKGEFHTAIQKGFIQTDKELLEADEDERPGRNDFTGSTAVFAIIGNKKLYCGNIGDSRAVACVYGHPYQVSIEHKPWSQEEMDRVARAGGFIRDGRVNGNLALCRALGDFYFKKSKKLATQDQMVCCFPDVTVRDVTPDYEFLILACDGIWDVYTNREAVNFVRDRIADGVKLEDICHQMLLTVCAPESTFTGLGADNMTLIIVLMKHGGSEEEARKKCFRPPIFPPPPPMNYHSYTYSDNTRTRLDRVLLMKQPDSQMKEMLVNLPPPSADLETEKKK